MEWGGGARRVPTDFARPCVRSWGCWQPSVLRYKRGPSFCTTFRQKCRDFAKMRTSCAPFRLCPWTMHGRRLFRCDPVLRNFEMSIWSLWSRQFPRSFAKKLISALLYAFNLFSQKSGPFAGRLSSAGSTGAPEIIGFPLNLNGNSMKNKGFGEGGEDFSKIWQVKS